MEKIKHFLEHWPVLYRIVRKIYIPLAVRYISFIGYLRRNRLPELWAAGHYHKGRKVTETVLGSISHPHRAFLVNKVANFSPIYNILEIGCDTGANLYLLAKRFPDAEIRGLDINTQAVAAGNEWFKREGIPNVQLSVGRAEALGKFPDKSFDVVLTDAVLIYINRDAIYRAFKEMVRVARRGLILVELYDFGEHGRDTQGLGVFAGGLWRRNYRNLLKQFAPEERIRVTRLTEDIWPDAGWIKHGALIEVTISWNGR